MSTAITIIAKEGTKDGYTGYNSKGFAGSVSFDGGGQYACRYTQGPVLKEGARLATQEEALTWLTLKLMGPVA